MVVADSWDAWIACPVSTENIFANLLLHGSFITLLYIGTIIYRVIMEKKHDQRLAEYLYYPEEIDEPKPNKATTSSQKKDADITGMRD
ncbi:unnamed protein product [Bursaphelenchus okinawaensis]|uniref:Uncharacterized protein n=1 Tax=Bursaphelenchus okinawaensis TaxID=465554 RepID=A0A811LQ36_9BILA|nr:unnamed protein product [Bursaphelenchus okinawaensis]CAG9127822.1 unnamed protein product [Bursaphelenchus okinawaensis]